ncbi:MULTISPECIES: cupredoxin domain-containing protein [unclassified Bradyrhizobium]|uniref:cupredoxin domain-containing protein n=1 Tax=unclassified Bradyrhizobium TaxID=2631580 RepID=UPI0028E22D72|nr:MULTISPECIES: cupredoxin domain-containing protein [unclassified Bradyrhizobium]
MSTVSLRKLAFAVAAWSAVLTLASAHAADTEIRLTYANGQFEPKEAAAPADKPFMIRVKNMEAKAMEFESKTLKVEKVIAAKSEAILKVRAMKPGRYEFFDEFNEKARGTVNVQ